MQSTINLNTTKNNIILTALPYLLFFTGSFIYFGFFADYIFFYQEKSSLFIFSLDFLLENLHRPGGILVFLGKFFSTFFYLPLVGAVIVSAILTLNVLIMSKIIGYLNGKRATIVPFLIGILLFYLQTDYRFFLINNLGVLLQLLFFYLSIRYVIFWRGYIPVLITPVWYFVTGGFAWLFCFMLTSDFVFNKEKRGWVKIIALWILILVTIYISKEFLFFQTAENLLKFPFSELNTGEQQSLFLFAIGILSILPLAAGIKFSIPHKLRVPDFMKGIATTIFIVMALIIIGFQRFDVKNKQYFHVENLFYQNKFDELIAYNIANPSNNSLTIFLNDISLCETDQMNDLLFHFRQSPDGKTLFLKWEMALEVLKRGGYFYYTIGMVNEAHRWAFENMVMKGHTPEGLKMLIKTELINGNYQMAAKYVAMLKKTLFYRGEAKQYELMLFNNAAVESSQELGKKRHNRLATDFFSITDDPYVNIQKILAGDTLNKKAFEYKIASLLLKKDLKGIVAELPKLEGYGFNKMPTHIAEAVVAYKLLKIGNLSETDNLRIDPQTVLRFAEFLKTMQFYGSDLKTAQAALRKNFGNTFWFYAFFL